MHQIAQVIQEIGNPVVFYPKLAKVFGIEETIFICQLLYWDGKGSSEDGFIHKTSEEIEEETSLTYRQQRRVRAKLRSLGLLSEYQKRLEHKTFYKINYDRVNELYSAKFVRHDEMSVPELTKGNTTKKQMVSSYYNVTKNTTKNTNKDTAAKAAVVTISIQKEKYPMKKVNRSTLLREQRREKTIGDKKKVMYRLAYHYLEVAGIEPTCFACDGTGYKNETDICHRCGGVGKFYDATKLARGLSQIYQECNKDEEEAKRRISVAGEYYNSKGLSWTPIAVWRNWELIQKWKEKDNTFLDLSSLE